MCQKDGGTFVPKRKIRTLKYVFRRRLHLHRQGAMMYTVPMSWGEVG
jgi:hypothetical protein